MVALEALKDAAIEVEYAVRDLEHDVEECHDQIEEIVDDYRNNFYKEQEENSEEIDRQQR